MRLLSIPGRHHENRYFGLILDGIEANGVTIVPPRMNTMLAFGYDVLHLNFPTHYVTENGPVAAAALSVVMAFYLVLARLLGRRIIYTVHDVTPLKQRNRPVLWPFLRLVHRLVNGYVFLSRSSQALFLRTYPAESRKPSVLARHGPYPTTRLPDDERAALRRSLDGGHDVFLLGFLGSIKPYKNVGALAALPATLADGRAIRTVVAGRIEAGFEAQIGAEIATLPAAGVIRLDQTLTDAALDGLIQAVDLVLLPYSKGSNSGAALLVLANGSRLVGSGLPMFRELAEDVGLPWVQVADSPDGLAHAVQSAAARGVRPGDRERLDAYLDEVAFAVGGRAIAAFCRSLASRGAEVASTPNRR